jgi:hypothetical protein
MNLENRLVAYIIYGLVVVRYSKLPIKLLNVDASIFFYPSSFRNFSLFTNGVATANFLSDFFQFNPLTLD